ncbi:MAG: 23S rRNA (pseudouridine(1915)-N(3))-methyltransferase RlmH [Candidatus Doudnabacteria bacterium CG10_big_fil_rev_8_21_14_0_10_41_10]|uniref:Ribosomal RNA large subunit methyltransferase H n=1 Tax=Candidatus Doudnabacteria bacterium CG10_big_fil_rev_8_21_14_0_10_41_10 TaxID=1974551 RepID=A0A2H0VFH5_9BACT|nr:MAG: 23S rRNA (pseudouridine(1915)-N(3))-methyltransferase RlmH [Candidatus Doudnabacteria bacterium CG10_big_fil_rev_8_21_14_0_10_41_10]
MLKFTIITVGKLKEQAFLTLEKEYLDRLSPYAKIKIVEIPEVAYRKEKDASKSRLKEAEIILKQIPEGSLVIALDEKGKTLTSQNFARVLAPYNATSREMTFIIGSSTGLSDDIKKKSNWFLSLSPLTFTHNFARILLEEQIYMALTILSEKIYHK